MENDDGGAELDSSYLGVFDNLDELSKQHFQSEKVSDDDIQKYIFAECVMQ